MAHVTLGTERKVMVVASLAYPVTGTLVRCAFHVAFFCECLLSIFIKFKWRFQSRFGCFLLCFTGVNLQCFKPQRLLVFVQFRRRFLGLSLDEVRRLASQVLGSLRLLAPVALLPPLEIIVLAFRALPASLGELKVPFRFLVPCLLTQFVRRYVRRRCARLRRRHCRRFRLLAVRFPFCRRFLQWRFFLYLEIDPIHICLQLVQVCCAVEFVVRS